MTNYFARFPDLKLSKNKLIDKKKSTFNMCSQFLRLISSAAAVIRSTIRFAVTVTDITTGTVNAASNLFQIFFLKFFQIFHCTKILCLIYQYYAEKYRV
jgi:hypothetical protein